MVHFQSISIIILQQSGVNPDRMIVFNLRNLLVNPCPLEFRTLNFINISFILQLQNIFPEKYWYFSIVLLTLKSCFVDEFYQPLHNWENIIYIQALQLERLKSIGTFQVD